MSSILADDGAVQREDALDADAEAGLAHRDRLADAAALARDDQTPSNAWRRSFVSDSLMRTCTRTVSPG